MKQILLSSKKRRKNYCEHYAIVDDEDYEWLIKYHWYVRFDGFNWYAGTNFLCSDGKRRGVSMHRMIMGCTIGDGKIIDHKDGNGLNNQRSNIRFATATQNAVNQRKPKGFTSEYMGVFFSSVIRKEYRKKTNDYRTWVSECWIAHITSNGKRIHLGRFKDEHQAAKAYNEAALKYHGEFARLNVITEKK